jgi:frataxin
MFSNPALRLRAPATRQSVRLSLRQQHSSPLSSAHSPIKASRLPSKAAIVNQSKSIFSDARAFHSSASRHGIMPDSADPTPPEPEAHQVVAKEPTDISYEEYHQHADAYLHDLVDRLEQEQEKRQDVEVDYSVCFPFFRDLRCSSLTNLAYIGWGSRNRHRVKRNLRLEQAATKQANLA